MDGKDDVSGSIMVISEDNMDSLCPMFFGISCAFFALGLLPEPEICDNRWSEVRNRVLKGSAHLLGLLVWRVQRRGVFVNAQYDLLNKLDSAQKQIVELKKRRSEEAKANEKVMSIFSAKEQSWFNERRQLRQQIDVLMNDLRVLEANKDRSISELGETLEDTQVIMRLKDELIEEGEQKRHEAEEKLKKAESLADELRECARIEGERHSCEIARQETELVELVSNQRQVEAEMVWSLRQAEGLQQEFDLVMEQKEQLNLVNQTLSMDLVKMHKDSEQKDQILSTMLRKSKLDTAEKQMLLKEVKAAEAKRKQAELEMKSWKAVSVSKHERESFRNMLPRHVSENRDVFTSSKALKTDCQHLTIDTFAEQLRLKDEKVEAFRWRLKSMELESKRFQAHVEGLDLDIQQLRQDNMKLEGLLLESEAELRLLKEHLIMHYCRPDCQKVSFNPSLDDTVWLKAKVFKRKLWHKRQEVKDTIQEVSEALKNNNKVDDTSTNGQFRDIVLTFESPSKEMEEGNMYVIESDGGINSKDAPNAKMATLVGSDLSKKSNSTWKVDIHSLSVLYKIKRLKQQLLMLERLTGKKESFDNSNGHFEVKGFYSLMPVLNKLVERYQSLHAKIDDLCKRMHENNVNLNSGGSTIARLQDETKRLEHFLEETFQIQRYIVATGQKLMEVQAKISSSFVGDALVIEKPEQFGMKQFADSIKTLVREVQRGLEVQISRIIGDLEGTLTCGGFHTSQD